MFIKQLGEEDFGLKMAVPRVWTDASTALQTAKRLGAGSRMRHIDVAALYVQELVYQKQLKVGKVAGTANPSNCLTKHLDAKLKGECLEDLGMVDISSSDWQPLIEAAEQIELVAALLSQRPKSKRTHRGNQISQSPLMRSKFASYNRWPECPQQSPRLRLTQALPWSDGIQNSGPGFGVARCP
jgi:hypothetical protein